jgi:hypothetical protein
MLPNTIANNGTIICRPLKRNAVETRRGNGLSLVANKTELEALEVLVGNPPSDKPHIPAKSLAYVRADRYTERWAKERITVSGFDEEVGGNPTPIQFIVVPVSEVVMYSEVVVAKWSSNGLGE